jgi:Cof subfamily protein (haloacid dehalogenase superfamily)
LPNDGTLYVSDLDGTLLRDDATLSERSRGILSGLLGDGLRFTVASARSVVAMQQLLVGLTLELPVIEFNGAFLSDLTTGRHLVTNSLDRAVVEDVFQMIVDRGCVPLVSTFDGRDDRLYYTGVRNPGEDWYVGDRIAASDRRLRQEDDLHSHLSEAVVCLTTIDRGDLMADLRDSIVERHGDAVATNCFESMYSLGWHWLTVYDRRATKDQALARLVEGWGLEGAELVVFGDGQNDIPMFEMADRAVAVENAANVLKIHATDVIGSNNDDSVALFVRDDWSSR